MPTIRGRFLCWLSAYAIAISAPAQTQQRVLVLDSLDGAPVAYAEVALDGVPMPITDADGLTILPWEPGTTVRVTIEQVGYGAQVRILSPRTPVVDGVRILRIAPLVLRLQPVAVQGPAPELVFNRPDLHAADLLINAEGAWVLAYERPRMLRSSSAAGKEILRDVRLVLLDSGFNEVASCPVPEDVLGLRHDFRDHVVIEGTRHAFAVQRTGEGLVLEPFQLDTLRRMVLPWTDSIPGWVLGSNADPDYPALEHVAWDPSKDTVRSICTVVDTFMMDLFRSNYKYLKGSDKVIAMDLAAQHGVDKETIAGFMSGFSRSIWYHPLYAPLFAVPDTLLVFDHARWRLRRFSGTLASLDDIPLTYGKRADANNWSGALLQDRETRIVHVRFQRNGHVWLRSVDPRTGALGPGHPLANTYPERVQVHGGSVYYIWRPYGSMQKRSIYRERL